MTRPFARIGLLAAICITASPAFAHIVFDAPRGTAGGYYAGVLRVSHGCGAAPTRSIRVEIPAAITIARPQPKPGWTLDVETQPLSEPVRGEGGDLITRRVSAIIWTGNLPADQFDTFGLMLKLPANPGPLFFPTKQLCERGENDWTGIPASPAAWHATPMPAPMLIVDEDHGMHGH